MSTISFPHLVQRVIAHRRPVESKGVDRHFRMDYMGASEFEWGALPDSLKRMRASKPAGVERISAPSPFESGTVCRAWYVGPPEEKATAQAFFADQLGAQTARLNEMTCIRASYDPNSTWTKYDGWWAVDESRERDARAPA